MQKKQINIFRSLAHPNYRLFFYGQGVSLIGSWIQNVALGWLVYRITGSAFLLGVVGFCELMPAFFLSPFAGVLSDRVNRRNLLLYSQVFLMLQAFILSALIFTNTVQVWHIIVLSLSMGVINGFEVTSRHAFVFDLVENKDNELGNAIALNSAMYNGARFVGPAIAGALIAVAGEGICFLINGISYIAVIATLAMMKLPAQKIPGKITARIFMKEFNEGAKYTVDFYPVRVIIIFIGFISFSAVAIATFLPVFAKDVLLGNAGTLGYLTSAVGLGALIGAAFMASGKNARGLVSIILAVALLCAAAMTGFALSKNIYLSSVALVIYGFCIMILLSASNTLLQTIIDPEKRGRVMGFYIMAYMGMVPLGNVVTGWLSNKYGAPKAVLAASLVCLLAALYFAVNERKLHRVIKPIYIKKGIISEIESGLGAIDGVFLKQ